MKRKKHNFILKILPYIIVAWLGNRAVYSFISAKGNDISAKFINSSNEFLNSISNNPMPSFEIEPLLGGILAALLTFWYIQNKTKNRRKVRDKREHGSAEFGTEKDIEPFIDFKNPDNNIILTASESLTMDFGKGILDRNKNVCVFGATGSGKTLTYVLPNLLQLTCSYVLTDPKGSVINQTGNMFVENKYIIKSFNTVEFSKSMHYNPFHYFGIFSENDLQDDISSFIDVLIENTNKEKNSGGDPFWDKAEKMLYTAYIGLIFTLFPKEQRNIITLFELITNSYAADENEESKKSIVDIIFEALEKWLNCEKIEVLNEQYSGINFTAPPTVSEQKIGNYSINFYKRFKQGAGKTLKSILISASARLSLFDNDSLAEMMRYDDLELEKIGDKKTVFFIIIDDSKKTYNFLVAIMYSQLFNLLYKRAGKNKDSRLPIHIRMILDEFANIGKISDFEGFISTMRSRNISVTVILQAISQLKTLYKENAETIISGCDCKLLLGANDLETAKYFTEIMGKETIDTSNYSHSHGKNGSTSRSDQRIGRDLITPDEIIRLDRKKCILQISGVKPFLSQKYNTFGHKRYKKLSTQFDIKKYIEKRKKQIEKQRILVINMGDEYELRNF